MNQTTVFEEGAAILPPKLRERALALPEGIRQKASELRLRVGREPAAVLEGDELPLPGEGRVSRRDLELTVEIATQASPQAALEQLRQGYFTLRGGHRLGLCGSVWTQEGQVKNLRRLSSLNLRLAHAVPGCGARVLRELGAEGVFPDTLILAPPGGGKTTLLRDLVRLLSDGLILPPLRVGLCDERGEVAALWEGEPQFDVGGRTDILEGCPKDQGLLMLLRAMTPQVLACDEITHPDDLRALETCGNCGSRLLATVHAGDVEELWEKPLYRELLRRKLFRRAVVVDRTRDDPYRVEVLS
ncbi:MAG: stage III sporulation protein AB [Oscillospiraceae bacterium]|nr:stage III sporulation protein AB [Oscillospiraceae bacterium]